MDSDKLNGLIASMLDEHYPGHTDINHKVAEEIQIRVEQQIMEIKYVNEGINDFQKGLCKMQCPYTAHTMEHKNWHIGYDGALREFAIRELNSNVPADRMRYIEVTPEMEINISNFCKGYVIAMNNKWKNSQ